MGNYFALPGMLPPDPHPYYTAGGFTRLSNGPMWPERLFPGMQVSSATTRTGNRVNYGYGSATTGPEAQMTGDPAGIDVLSQVSRFEADLAQGRVRVAPSDIFMVEAGPNDLFAAIAEGRDVPTAVAGVATNLATAVNRLAARGARTILVHDMPDVAYAPIFTQAALPPELKEAFRQQLNAVTAQARETLAAELNAAAEKLPQDVNVVTVPLNRLFTEIRDNAAAYGFADTERGVYDEATGELRASSVAEQNRYLFVDSLHLTTHAQMWEARYYGQLIEAVDGTAGRRGARLVDGAVAGLEVLRRQAEARASGLLHRPETGWSAFFTTGGARERRDAGSDAAGWRASMGATLAGAEYRFDEHYALGGGIGYFHQNGSVDERRLEYRLRGTAASLYAARTWGNYYARAAVLHAGLDLSSSRETDMPTLRPKGDSEGRGEALLFAVGRSMRLGQWSLWPELRLEQVRGEIEAFTESAAAGLELRYDDLERRTWRGGLEVTFQREGYRWGGHSFARF